MINLLSRQRYFLALIFITALSLRIGYAFLEKVTPFQDAAGFDEIGRHIAEGKGYRISDGPIEEDKAVLWPPGYPFFLGLTYKIFGHSYPAVWIIQSIIAAFICILIFFIANRLFGREVARVSAIISAICFNLVIYPAMLLSETLFLLLILLCFIYIYKTDALSLDSRYVIAGIFGGLSVLTRPIILIFFLFFGIVSFKKNNRGIMLFLFPIILFVSFWIARNYYIYHRFIPITTVGDQIWDGHHLQATGRYNMPEDISGNLSGQEYLKMEKLGYLRGLEFILKHPIKTLFLELRKISLFFSLLRTDGWWPYMKGIGRIFSLILSLLFNLLIFGFGITGIVFSYAKVNKYISWMRKFIFISVLSLIPFIVEARYRLTVYPFMIIFASYALSILPKIRPAFISGDKQIIRLLHLSTFLLCLLILNSIYDLFMCRNEIFFRLHILKSVIPYP